jgi:hypothetical protein
MALGNLLVSIRASASQWASDVKSIQREAKELERSVKPITAAFKDIGKVASIAGLAITGALAGAIKSAANYGDEINDAAKRTGLATEELSKLRLAAETSGSSFEGLATGLKFLGKNMELANAGSKEQIRAFAAAGISAQDLANAHGDVNKVFTQLADTFAGAEDGAGKTAVSMALLGRSGTDLIPMLNEGSAGLKRWGDEAQRAGRVVTAEAAQAADEFNDRLRVLEVSVLGLGSSIGNALIPKLTEWVNEGTKVIQQVREWTSENKRLADGLGATGLILAGAGGIAVALAALPALIGKVRVGWAALTGTLSATTLGIGAIITAIITFRKELTVGLLSAVGIAALALEKFVGVAAEAMRLLGNNVLASSLQNISSKIGAYRQHLADTVVVLLEQNEATADTADELEMTAAWFKKAEERAKGFKNELRLQSDASSEAAKKLEQFRAQFAASLRPADELNKQMAMLAGKFSDNDIIAVYAKAIVDAADAQREHGLAITGEVARLEDWARAHTALLDELRAEKKLREDIAEILKNNKPQALNTPLGGLPFPTTVTNLPPGGFKLPIKIEVPEFPDLTKKWDEWADAGQSAIDSIVNDMSKMFTDMIGHGRSLWEAFKGLGRSAVAAVADTFLKTMMHSFLDPFAQSLGNIMKSVAGGGEKLATGDWIGAAIAGVAALGAALSSAIGQGRKEADRFVQTFQNPFGDAIKTVFDALSQAKDMGTLTVDQTKKARGEIEKLWTSFQAEAAKASHGVGQQAIATIAPLMESWRVWLDGLDQSAIASEAAAESLQDMIEQQEAVIAIMERVLKASAGASGLSDAIQRLQAEGVPAANIITILGGDIKDMTELMISLGQNVPPAISGLYDLANAIEEIGRIGQELEDVFNQLGDALNSRLDQIENDIRQSQDNIDSWSKELQDVNDRIEINSATLADAAYWQDQYNDAIQDAINKLETLTSKQKSIQKQIRDTTYETERDRLETIRDTTKDIATYYQTQKRIEDLDAAHRADLAKDRSDSVTDLQSELALVNLQIQIATKAVETAGETAALAITRAQSDLAIKLESDKQLRASLTATMAVEQERIKYLQEGHAIITDLMNAAGIARTNEADALSNTINQLMYRGLLLEQERDRLLGVTGAAESANHVFATLADTLARFTLTQAAPLPQYHAGTPYVPVTGPAMLEKGEAVVSASQNRSGDWSGGEMHLHIEGDVYGDEQSLNRLADKIHQKLWNKINHGDSRPLTRKGR